MGSSTTGIATAPGLATFNGTSSFAGSLTNEINQAVNIASIPIEQLQYNISTLQGQSSELTKLQTDFAAVQTAIQSLSSVSGGSSLTASVSNNTIATATLNSSQAVSGGTYTLNILDPGSSTSTLSNNGLSTVSDPTSTSISTSSNYNLTVNGSTFSISPTSDTLNSLAQAINGANAGVSATILNLGSPTSPDYRLSLQSNSLGPSTIQLNDGSQDLLSTLTTGTPAQYQINGQPSTPISSNSSTVTIAPGVSVNLLAAGQTTINVAPDPTAAETALSSLVTAYNASEAELATNHGTADGSLIGQSIVLQLSQSLSDIVNYSGGSGSVSGLASLGITFNSTGQLQFDQSAYESTVATDPNDVAAFLGSATGGTGFLGAANNTLNGLLDSTQGVFTTTNQTFQSQISTDHSEITADTERIAIMQNSLVAQMSAADALIASLQSKVSYFTTLFQDTQNELTSNG